MEGSRMHLSCAPCLLLRGGANCSGPACIPLGPGKGHQRGEARGAEQVSPTAQDLRPQRGISKEAGLKEGQTEWKASVEVKNKWSWIERESKVTGTARPKLEAGMSKMVERERSREREKYSRSIAIYQNPKY